MESEFWTYYDEDGVVDNIELRLKTWNNKILLAYASAVRFNSSENDPDGKIWDKIVKKVEENPEKVFDEYGDFKEDLVITEEDIREMAKIFEQQ